MGEGEGAFWDNQRTSRWTQPERKQKCKKIRTAIRNALQGDAQDGGGGGGASPRCTDASLGRRTFLRPRQPFRGVLSKGGAT